MQLSLSARILWAAGFAELVALLIVLAGKRRWRDFPFFTAWISFLVIETVGLFLLYRSGLNRLYAYSYWGCEGIDLALQICIVVELARNVLRPTGKWVRDAKLYFIAFALLGGLIAVGAAFLVNPKLPYSFDDWMDKGLLFSAMLNLQLFLAMTWTASRLGLIWRNHVVGIATGWAIWAIADLFVEAASSYFGVKWHGLVLDQIRMIAFQLATIYWAWNLWLPEPQGRILSAEMKAYLGRLQKETEDSLKVAKQVERV